MHLSRMLYRVGALAEERRAGGCDKGVLVAEREYGGVEWSLCVDGEVIADGRLSMWGEGEVICILSRMLYRVGALAEERRVGGCDKGVFVVERVWRSGVELVCGRRGDS